MTVSSSSQLLCLPWRRRYWYSRCELCCVYYLGDVVTGTVDVNLFDSEFSAGVDVIAQKHLTKRTSTELSTSLPVQRSGGYTHTHTCRYVKLCLLYFYFSSNCPAAINGNNLHTQIFHTSVTKLLPHREITSEHKQFPLSTSPSSDLLN